MKNKLIVIFSLLTLGSCQPIMMKIYGIKKPEIENEKTIIKKALKYNMDTSNIFSVNSKDFVQIFKGKSIPDGALYDKNGKYIEYRQTDTSCNAGLFDFIPALNLTGQYNQPDSSRLDFMLNKFRDLKGNKLPPRKDADFYLLIYWTVWSGKLNRDHVKAWENLARENKSCNIQVYKMNMDVQDNWEPQERDKIVKALGMKK